MGFCPEENIYCQICSETRIHSLVYIKNNIPIFRCKVCGVGRAVVNDFVPEKYYTEKYFSGEYKESYVDYPGSEDVLSREFRKTVKYLRRFYPGAGKCLEIGCAYGFFLQEAKPFYDVYGVEMSEAAVRHCLNNGLLNVQQGKLTEDFCHKNGKFDIAIMLDVIEHIDNLEELILIVSKNLKSGGVFMLTTGDWSSLVSRLTGASWRLMAPPAHLWYLTPQSIDILMQRNGMVRIEKSYPWKIVPFNLIIKQALLMLGFKSEIFLTKNFRTIGFPANLYDSMRLVYRKI